MHRVFLFIFFLFLFFFLGGGGGVGGGRDASASVLSKKRCERFASEEMFLSAFLYRKGASADVLAREVGVIDFARDAAIGVLVQEEQNASASVSALRRGG